MRFLPAFILAIALLLSAPAYAALEEWNIEVQLNDDKTSVWNVTLVYNESVSKSDYYILGNVVSYDVFADGMRTDCRISRDFGSSIVCENLFAKKVRYEIKTAPIVVDVLQNFRLFTYKFAATQLAGRFAVTVKLPLGSVLAEETRLSGAGLRPFEPEYGTEGSDGRIIFVKWDLLNPSLGETLDVTVVYEQLETPLQLALFGAIIAVLVGGLLSFMFFYRKGPMKDILPVLTDNERKVVEIVMREKSGADQRQIVRETDFSKAKVSRLISDLANRGVIEKISRGRKNLIRLKGKIKPDKEK